MVIVYGADWCEDTRRSLRLLRRLGVAHHYRNIDEDFNALGKALTLTGGRRRTPVIDLALGGQISIFDVAQESRHIENRDLTPAAGVLVEPDNDTLTAALVEREMLTPDTLRERMAAQNVGDLERVLRAASGAGLLLAAVMRRGPWPLRIAGGALALSGLTGWCPAYSLASVSSLGGPGDRPNEAHRTSWLTRSHEAAQ